MRLRVTALALIASLALPAVARAQVETREGIYLQNQLLQLRQELEQMRARGGSSLGAAPAPSPRGGGGGSELVGQLLDRVTTMEDEVRRMRGRLDETENATRRLAEDTRKLNEDMEYRFQRLEGGGGAAPAPARPAAPGPGLTPPARGGADAAPAGAPPAAAAPRPPQRALADGQAALGRRDYAAAEAAAREVIANRAAASSQANAQLLLGDALIGKRDFGNAAIAYNESYTRGRATPRGPEALVGLANAFQQLGHRREACDTLADLRSNHPTIPAPLQERANAVRTRAQCR